MSAGGGYTTELLARAVGPQGVVYAQTPKPSPRLIDRLKSPALKNVVLVPRKFDEPVPPEAKGLDLVTLMFNYHDFGHFGVDRASQPIRCDTPGTAHQASIFTRVGRRWPRALARRASRTA